VLSDAERRAIDRLWSRKLDQDKQGLPQSARHRNLEPDSAEFIHALAAGCGARSLLEIGGSSGLSTIALAAAARSTSGRLTSIEIEPARQQEARANLQALQTADYVEFVLGDARDHLPKIGPFDFVLIDCEKDDYVPFFDGLRLAPGAVVVADNIVSHALWGYVGHVRSRPGVQSMTLPIGKGLEVSRIGVPARQGADGAERSGAGSL
jgi:predicted O-methyltransferase YrrM